MLTFRYLFCDLSHGWPQCASKIVVGGNCTGFVRGEIGFKGEDCCYNGRCVNNICVWNANNFGTRPRLLTVPGTRIRPFSLATSPVRSSISRASKKMNDDQLPPKAESTRVGTIAYFTMLFSCYFLLYLLTSVFSVMSCTDYHFCCAFWSTQNRCTGGQSIQQACPMSCNVCTANISSSNTDCQDFHPLCEAWANSRLCDTRQDYMWENCKWSCRKCDLLRPSSRAAACESIRRPLFRTVLRQPNALSEFQSENEYVTAEEPQTPTTTTLSSY
ncbi:hypothetical protein GCK32_007001 [Trichostrongylus colubriformis]|uniref:ShKT domain-containing protein n=1 Tax=Trichostrongylus colubriformis TaxID=6319 RepID=A0AAN8G8I2_TRICO